MSDRDTLGRLSGIATATEDLAPEAALADEVVLRAAREATLDLDASSDLDDAVMAAIELEELGRATDALAPADGLTDAVLAAAASEAAAIAPRNELALTSRWPSRSLIRSSRAALFAAAAVAAVSVGYATYAEQRLDTEVMASVDAVELEE